MSSWVAVIVVTYMAYVMFERGSILSPYKKDDKLNIDDPKLEDKIRKKYFKED
jgi:hypothetical protein